MRRRIKGSGAAVRNDVVAIRFYGEVNLVVVVGESFTLRSIVELVRFVIRCIKHIVPCVHVALIRSLVADLKLDETIANILIVEEGFEWNHKKTG